MGGQVGGSTGHKANLSLEIELRLSLVIMDMGLETWDMGNGIKGQGIKVNG